MKTSEVQALHQRFIDTCDIIETQLIRVISDWTDQQVNLGKMTNEEAGQIYYPYESDSPDHLAFRCEPWEEYWAYGGHEHHDENFIKIPLAFFDDPEAYKQQLEAERAEIENRVHEHQKKVAKATVKRLEEELAKAKQKADSL